MSEVYDWSLLFKGITNMTLVVDSEWKNFYDPENNVKRVTIQSPVPSLSYDVNISVCGDEYGKYYLLAHVSMSQDELFEPSQNKEFLVSGLFSTKTEYPYFLTRHAAREHIEQRWIPTIARRKS